MRKPWNLTLLALSLLVAGGSGLTAEDLALPADRQWEVQVDLRQLGAHGFAEVLSAIDQLPQIANSIGDVGHLHLASDITRLTIAGTDTPTEALAYLEGRFDAEALGALADHLPEHHSTRHGSHTLQAWRRPKDQRSGFACVINDHLLLLGQDAKQLELALDRLDDDATAPLPRSGSLAALLPAIEPFLIRGAAISVAGIHGAKPQSAIAKRLRSLTVVATATGTEIAIALTGTTDDEAVAGKLVQLVQGLQAMIQLNATTPPAHPLVAALLEHAQVARTGSALSVTTTVPEAQLVQILHTRLAQRGHAESP